LVKPKSFTEKRTSGFLPSSKIPSENIFTQSSLLATLQDPLTMIDHFSDFWSKLGAPISFIYGILAGISPWIFTRIRRRVRRNDDGDKKDKKSEN
jgi:hypothetical protein